MASACGSVTHAWGWRGAGAVFRVRVAEVVPGVRAEALGSDRSPCIDLGGVTRRPSTWVDLSTWVDPGVVCVLCTHHGFHTISIFPIANGMIPGGWQS